MRLPARLTTRCLAAASVIGLAAVAACGADNSTATSQSTPSTPATTSPASTATASTPATPQGFHTTFHLTGVNGSSITGTVLDVHTPGTANFEKETWSVAGAKPGTDYVPFITLGGCWATAGVPKPLPIAVAANPAATNASGAFTAIVPIPQAGLAEYLQEVKINPADLPAQVPAQLLVTEAYQANLSFEPTTTAEEHAVARSDCQMVATRN